MSFVGVPRFVPDLPPIPDLAHVGWPAVTLAAVCGLALVARRWLKERGATQRLDILERGRTERSAHVLQARLAHYQAVSTCGDDSAAMNALVDSAPAVWGADASSGTERERASYDRREATTSGPAAPAHPPAPRAPDSDADIFGAYGTRPWVLQAAPGRHRSAGSSSGAVPRT